MPNQEDPEVAPVGARLLSIPTLTKANARTWLRASCGIGTGTERVASRVVRRSPPRESVRCASGAGPVAPSAAPVPAVAAATAALMEGSSGRSARGPAPLIANPRNEFGPPSWNLSDHNASF